jgi:hypothetical protein
MGHNAVYNARVIPFGAYLREVRESDVFTHNPPYPSIYMRFRFSTLQSISNDKRSITFY